MKNVRPNIASPASSIHMEPLKIPHSNFYTNHPPSSQDSQQSEQESFAASAENRACVNASASMTSEGLPGGRQVVHWKQYFRRCFSSPGGVWPAGPLCHFFVGRQWKATGSIPHHGRMVGSDGKDRAGCSFHHYSWFPIVVLQG